MNFKKATVLVFFLIISLTKSYGQNNFVSIHNQYMSKISLMYLDLATKGKALNIKDPCGDQVPYNEEIVGNLNKSIQAASQIKDKGMRKQLSDKIKNSITYQLIAKNHFSIKLSILLLDEYDFPYLNQNEVNIEDIKKALINSRFSQDPHGRRGDYFIFLKDFVNYNYVVDRATAKEIWQSEVKTYVVDYDNGKFIIVIDGQKFYLSNYLYLPSLENEDNSGSMAYSEFTSECGL